MANFCPAITEITINSEKFNDFYDFFDRCYWVHRLDHTGFSEKFTKYGSDAETVDHLQFLDDLSDTVSEYFQPFLDKTPISDFTWEDGDPINTDTPTAEEMDIDAFEKIKINGTRIIDIFEEMFWMHLKVSEWQRNIDDALENSVWTGDNKTPWSDYRATPKGAYYPRKRVTPKLASREQAKKKQAKDFKLDDSSIPEDGEWVFCGKNTSTRRVYKHIPGNPTAKFDTLEGAIEASDEFGGISITLARDGKYQLREQNTVYPDYREAGSWVLKDGLKNGKLKVSRSCPTGKDPLKLDSCDKTGLFWEQTEW